MTDSAWWIDSAELDDAQRDVISLPPDGDFLVVGPPGSGKTNLLLLRASYLVDSQRPNVAVLMFTRSLREFVVRGTGNYSFAEDKVQTIMHWERQLIREHGGALPPDDLPFDERRLAHAEALKGLLDQKPALEHHLDCILVDEVQDCLPEEIDLFFRAARNVFFVGDHRQQIFAKNALLDVLKTKVEVRELTTHYRNGELVCKIADTIGKTFGELPLLGSCNYDETKAKSSVVVEACSDGTDMIHRLTARLIQQLKAYPGELLGVACPKKEDVRTVRAALTANPQLAKHLLSEGEYDDPLDSQKRICLCNIHQAKGLEFRAMHLLFAEHLKQMGELQKRLAFTIVTRAKTSLAIYHVRPLPGYLEQARDAIAPPKPPPVVSDLFTRKKK